MGIGKHTKPTKTRPSRGRKTPTDGVPQALTPEQVIAARRKQLRNRRDVTSFLQRLVIMVLMLWVLFGFVFGLTPMPNGDMSPRLSAGDLMLYYRMVSTWHTQDIAVLEKDGTQYVARIVAQPGDTIAVPGSGSVYVKNGVNAGKIHIADSVFTPGTTASTKYEAQNEVTFDAGTFTAPGIYYYTVSENSGSYDGITYDNSTLKMYVYVVNDESTTPASYKVDGIVVTKSGTTKGEGFDNKYEVDKNNDGKLVLTKEVTGTQGDKNAPWTFKIKIAGPAGEKYLTSVGGTVIDANAQTATEVTLKHRQTFTIYGLSAGDKVEIVEDEANTEGYTTTYATAGKDEVYGNAVRYTDGVKAAGNAYVKVINEKNIATPGGVIMTIAPYALMVVLAGAFAVVFLTRRNRAE